MLIATETLPAGEFNLAEEYHQDFYKKNAAHYNRYKKGSGRVDYLERSWGGDSASKTERKSDSQSVP